MKLCVLKVAEGDPHSIEQMAIVELPELAAAVERIARGESTLDDEAKRLADDRKIVVLGPKHP